MYEMTEGYFTLFMRTGDPRFYLLSKRNAKREEQACRRS